MAATKRDVIATLRTERRGDRSVFKAAADELERLEKSTKATGDQAGRSGKRIDRLEKEIRQLRKALNRAKRDLDKFTRTGKGVGRLAKSFGKLKTVLTGLVAINVGQRLLQSVSVIADFSEQMAKVRAVSGATEQQWQALVAKAKELGAATEHTASQAGAGMEDLARAGLKPTEIFHSIGGALNLATAGAIEMSDAADISTNVMSSFGMAVDDFNSICDILAITTASSNTNIISLGESIKEVGALADNVGFSLQETAAVIGVLGNNAIKGTAAGTGLKAIIASLENVTPKAEQALKRMGLSVEDVTPHLHTMEEIVATLAEKNLSTADAFEIFGRKGANAILVLTKNVDQLRELKTEIKGGADAAEAMARVMRDNLGGDIKALGSALEGLILQAGDGGLGAALRGVTQDFTGFIRGLSQEGNSAGQTIGSLVILISTLVKGVNAGMTTISGAVGLALGSIAHSVLELVDLINEIPGFDKLISDDDLQHARDAVHAFIKNVAEDTEQGLRGARDSLSTDLDRLVDLWSGAGKAAADGVGKTNEEVGKLDGKPIEDLGQSLASFIEKVNTATSQELSGKLGQGLAEEARNLIAEFQKLGKEVPEHLQEIATSLDNGTAKWRKGIQELGQNIDVFRGKSEEQKNAVQQHFREMVAAIKGAGEAIGPEIVAVGAQIGVMVSQFDPATAAVKRTGEEVVVVGNKFTQVAKGSRDVTAEVDAMAAAMKKARLESEGTADNLDTVADTAASAGPKIKEGAEAAGEAAEQYRETASKVEEGTEALSEQGEAAARAGQQLDQTRKAADSLSEAEQKVKSDITDLNAELAAIQGSLDSVKTGFSEAAEAVRTAFADLKGFTGPIDSALDTTLGKLDQVIEKLHQVQNAGSASGAP